MDHQLHKINYKRYGELYAGALLKNTNAMLRNLPELLDDQEFKKLRYFAQEKVLMYIKCAAKRFLVAKGYSAAGLDKIFSR